MLRLGNMRTAIICYAFYDGNFRIQRYGEALAARGDTVDVIALNPGNLPAFETVKGINIYRVQGREMIKESRAGYLMRVMFFMLRAFFLITRKHLQKRYDLIHVHSVPDFLVFTCIIPKLSGTKIILDIHDILPEFYSTRYGKTRGSFFVKILIFLERVSNKFSDYVIIANPIWHERLISRGLNPDKLITIPNYPNPEIFFPRSKKSSNGKFVATYPGTLNWHQGLDIAVQAYARVIQEYPEAEFHIYGAGPEKDKLVQLVGELKVEKNVLFRDFLPIDEIVTVMANSDLAIVPKRSKSTFGTEAASTKILEFMSVGVPIVVSRTKIDSHYHTDSTVKFYDSDDPNQLADAILEMMRDPSLRNRLSANALAYAQEQSWDRKKIEYLAIVDSLVSHK